VIPNFGTKHYKFYYVCEYTFLNLHIRLAAIENACVGKKLQYFAEACRTSKFEKVSHFLRSFSQANFDWCIIRYDRTITIDYHFSVYTAAKKVIATLTRAMFG